MLGAAAVIVLATVAGSGCSADTEVLAARSPTASGSAAGLPAASPAGGATESAPAVAAPASTPPSTQPAPTQPTRPTPTSPTDVATNGPTARSTDQGTPDQPGEPDVDLPPAAAGPPDGWPADVGLPPGAEIFTDPTADDAGTLAFRASGSPTDLADFFRAELTAAGFTRADAATAGDAATATYTRGGSTVQVTLVAGEGVTVGTVTTTP